MMVENARESSGVLHICSSRRSSSVEEEKEDLFVSLLSAFLQVPNVLGGCSLCSHDVLQPAAHFALQLFFRFLLRFIAGSNNEMRWQTLLQRVSSLIGQNGPGKFIGRLLVCYTHVYMESASQAIVNSSSVYSHCPSFSILFCWLSFFW